MVPWTHRVRSESIPGKREGGRPPVRPTAWCLPDAYQELRCQARQTLLRWFVEAEDGISRFGGGTKFPGKILVRSEAVPPINRALLLPCSSGTHHGRGFL